MRTLSALVLATALGFASLAHAGGAMVVVPDLTGTWTGTLSCKGISTSPFLFGGFNFVAKEATLAITQTDDQLIAELEAEDPSYPQPLVGTMCGPVVVDPEKPKKVRAGLVLPPLSGPGSPVFAFAVDFSSAKVFAENPKGVSGKLKGKGVLIASGLGGSISGSCKWTFERTDDTPPVDPPTSCNPDPA